MGEKKTTFILITVIILIAAFSLITGILLAVPNQKGTITVGQGHVYE